MVYKTQVFSVEIRVKNTKGEDELHHFEANVCGSGLSVAHSLLSMIKYTIEEITNMRNKEILEIAVKRIEPKNEGE